MNNWRRPADKTSCAMGAGAREEYMFDFLSIKSLTAFGEDSHM
jgi:hypothetical protein